MKVLACFRLGFSYRYEWESCMKELNLAYMTYVDIR